MKRASKIKKEVWKAVYEDNAGIPRSHTGKRYAATVEEPHPTAPRSGYWSRAVLVLLLGLLSLIGMNFRLIKLDVTGPVAMQKLDQQSLQYLTDPLFMRTEPVTGFSLDDRQAASIVPVNLHGDDAAITTGRYDDMLTRLGMPMADLFNLQVRTIVIDPGHGGIDPGATGRQGLMEKDVALDIARKLRDELASAGSYRVLLTREDDRKVYLKERVAFAKDNRADLFISIHINSLPPVSASVNYMETYYFGPHTDQRSLELADKENHDSDYAMGDFREVIARIGDTLKTEESKELADAIHGRLYSNLKRRNRDLINAGTKTGPFVVLLGVEVPSVLVEVSCISNKAEETRLSQPEYRDAIAVSLKVGIVEYLEQRGYRRSVEGGKVQHVAKQEG